MTEIDTYKTCTDEIYKLFNSFKKSGFDHGEAFELTKVYVRQSMFDNLLRDQQVSSKRDAMARYMQKKYENKEINKDD